MKTLEQLAKKSGCVGNIEIAIFAKGFKASSDGVGITSSPYVTGSRFEIVWCAGYVASDTEQNHEYFSKNPDQAKLVDMELSRYLEEKYSNNSED